MEVCGKKSYLDILNSSSTHWNTSKRPKDWNSKWKAHISNEEKMENGNKMKKMEFKMEVMYN